MISVIIPFFNAKEFILESVASAVNQALVSEVIIIYDGCKNISFNELKILLTKFSKIKLIHHVEFKNKGAGASRNLGVKNSSNAWISFLDADDLFLPNRFDCFEKLLENSFYFDGLYEAAVYEGSGKIYSISKPINPEKLFHFLIRGTYGHFCTDGIIVKKDLLFKAGLFNENLNLHQDSELWLRLAFYGKLIPGSLEKAVSVIRKHKGNRIWNGTTPESRLKQWYATWKWAKREKIGLINRILIIRKILKYKIDYMNG